MTERIGIMVGMEDSFPAAFIESVNRRPGFQAELVKVGGVPERLTSSYSVIVDRISHEVPFYRHYLKAAALAGVYVINDPFWWSADDKFFGFSLAKKLGVATPRTVMLPSPACAAPCNPSSPRSRPWRSSPAASRSPATSADSSTAVAG